MKNITPKYVTEATFEKELQIIYRRFDGVDQRFDGVDEAINRIAVMVVRHDADIKEIKATMMTKTDGDKIMTLLQDFATEYREEKNSARIHLNQLMEFRPRIDDHENRLVALENQVRPKA